MTPQRGGLGNLRPDQQDVLRADLCAPKYEQRSNGRIALEPKKQIRKRTGRSPDHGDALALALTRPAPRWGWTGGDSSRDEDDEDRWGTPRPRTLDEVMGDYCAGGAGLDDW